MKLRHWPAYSAVLLLAVGVACLIALVFKSPADEDSAALAKRTQRSTATTVAMPANSSSAGAARSS